MSGQPGSAGTLARNLSPFFRNAAWSSLSGTVPVELLPRPILEAAGPLDLKLAYDTLSFFFFFI